MKASRTLQIAAATVVCAAAAAQSALAGGESKNAAPFTRPAADGRSATSAVSISATAIASARAAIAGETKNEQPFTRSFYVADALARYVAHTTRLATSTALLGEPKNQVALHASASAQALDHRARSQHSRPRPKSGRGLSNPPPCGRRAGSRRSERDHLADRLAPCQAIEPLVDVVQRQTVADQPVDRQAALLVPLDQIRDVAGRHRRSEIRAS